MKINEFVTETTTATRENYIQLIHQLLDAVNNRDEKTASEIFLAMSRFWILFQVVEYIWRHVSDKSNAAWIFSLLKRPIVSYILSELKDDPEQTYVPTQIIQILKKAGMDWPELDIIQKSLNADNKVTETITVNAQSHSKISSILIKKIENRDTEDLTELFLAMSRYLMLHQVLAQVLHYVLNRKSAVWFFNLQKKPIITYLLGELKEGEDCEIELITSVLDVLDEAKIKWPELDIIKRSLRADHKLKEEESDKYEYEIQHTLEEIDIQLSNRQASVITWIYRLKHYGALSRVIPLIEKYKKNVIKIAETKIKQGSIHTFLEMKQLLDEAGAHVPELDTIIEDNKDTIVKLILEKMKKGRVAVAGSDLRILYKIGINWPELKIIQRSVDAENSNK